MLVAVAFLSVLSVAFASLRHTGSIAFPVDDGYIYSNYVASAVQGHAFSYNPGETSGGITGLGWWILCTVAYVLLAPFHDLLGALGPPAVSLDAPLSAQAAHLYLAAYLPGAVCLVATSLGVRRLALLALPAPANKQHARSVFCWLLAAMSGADLGMVWGAASGLEVPLSTALAIWAIYLLAKETRSGMLKWSLLLVAVMPWARPDLAIMGVAGVAWLACRAVAAGEPVGARRVLLRSCGVYLIALLAGLGLMSLVYYVGWGRPLPSSFYAKVGGLRLGGKFFSAAQELIVAGRTLPFATAGAALTGAIATWLPVRGAERQSPSVIEARWTSLLLLITSGLYVAGIMASLPWFGQEDRYLLPVHPLVLILAGLLVWRVARLLPVEALLSRSSVVAGGAIAVIVTLVGVNYVWATRDYVVQVRNISDAHIAPALWFAEHTPADSIVASEPIGAVRLFSGRRTVDLVGLTTPSTLGTYRDWPRSALALKAAGATYLLFYPRWFDGEHAPAWAIEEQRFVIPDNRVAGDDVIAIYKLDWARLPSP